MTVFFVTQDSVTFTDQDSMSIVFDDPHFDDPIIILTAFDTGGNISNVRLHMSDVTINGFTINSSDVFTGKVNYRGLSLVP